MSKKKKDKRKKRSVAAATAKRRERSQQSDSDLYVLPEGAQPFSIDAAGTHRLDIIPYTTGKHNPNADEGAFYWEYTFFIHRNIGVNNKWVVCPAKTYNKPCPICEFVNKLKADPEAEEGAEKALSISKRMLLNVRDLKKDPDTVKVWHVSHAYFGDALDKALKAAYEDEGDNMDNFCDPEDGHYLKCEAEKGWQGKGFSIERVDFKPRKEDLDDSILEQAVCLEDILTVKDYNELKELLYAGTDEEDEDEKPKKSKSKTKVKDKKKEEDDEDEEDWENDDDDDGDEPEEDEDDNDEDSEDEDDGDEDAPEEDDDDDDGDEDEGDSDNDDDDDDDDSDDWGDDDDDDEDEKPKKSPPKKKKKVKRKR